VAHVRPIYNGRTGLEVNRYVDPVIEVTGSTYRCSSLYVIATPQDVSALTLSFLFFSLFLLSLIRLLNPSCPQSPPSISSSSPTLQNNSSVVAEVGDRLATIDVGQKVGAAVPLSVGGAESPSSTMWPEPRPTSVPSGILIHSAVWLQ